MQVRPCREDDVAVIAAIYGHAVLTGRASFELEPPDTAEMFRRRSAILEGGYPYLVAEMDGRVGGYAYCGPYRTRPAYRATVENSVYVAEGQQGRGVGRALLTALVEAASGGPFRQMVAVIGDSANLASIRLHEACGFRHAGTLRSVGWKHGTWLDSVFMQRALGPGDTIPSDMGVPAR